MGGLGWIWWWTGGRWAHYAGGWKWFWFCRLLESWDNVIHNLWYNEIPSIMQYPRYHVVPFLVNYVHTQSLSFQLQVLSLVLSCPSALCFYFAQLKTDFLLLFHYKFHRVNDLFKKGFCRHMNSNLTRIIWKVDNPNIIIKTRKKWEMKNTRPDKEIIFTGNLRTLQAFTFTQGKRECGEHKHLHPSTVFEGFPSQIPI